MQKNFEIMCLRELQISLWKERVLKMVCVGFKMLYTKLKLFLIILFHKLLEVYLLIFMDYVTVTAINCRIFLSPQIEALSISSHSLFLSIQPLAVTNLLHGIVYPGTVIQVD